MKNKLIKIIIVVLSIFLGYKTYKLFINEYKIEYNVEKYVIKEYFYKKNNYDIIISNNKNKYIYSLNNNFNKNKKIIKTIKEYKSDNLICIVPIYKKNINKNIFCNLDNKQVSIDYLLKSNNKNFTKIKNNLGKMKVSIPKSDDTKEKYKKIDVYKNNILNNEKIFIWDYKGIYILSKNKLSYQKILDYDLYDNLMVTVTDNYYVLFENNSVNGIKNVYYYDIKKNKLKKYVLKTIISKDSYINGIYDNLIYVTDNKNKKQYTVNIGKKKIEEIDNSQTEYIVYNNNKKEILSKSDFFMKKQYFINRDNNYYYYKEDNKIYKSFSSNKKKSVLLLELEDIKEWTVVDEEVVLLTGGDIYFYNDTKGLRKIISSNELKYNYKNIYKLWKK